MYISAKVDYATRALLGLVETPPGRWVPGEALASDQGLPVRFVENILSDLRRAGFVVSHRGHDGGYRLARPAEEIRIADIFRSLEGPLAEVRGLRPEAAAYQGNARHLQEVWVGVRAALRLVLESVTLADVATGRLGDHVGRLVADPDAWQPH